MDPWRYSTQGISVALRVTPRGGRDDIDGLETLANGRTVRQGAGSRHRRWRRSQSRGDGADREGARGAQGQGADPLRHDLAPQADCRRRRSRRNSARRLRVADRRQKQRIEMTARIIDGKVIASELRARVAGEVARVQREHGLTPGLAVVLVGSDPASQVYVRSKHKQTQAAGMASFEHVLPADVAQDDLLALIAQAQSRSRRARHPGAAAAAEIAAYRNHHQRHRSRQGCRRAASEQCRTPRRRLCRAVALHAARLHHSDQERARLAGRHERHRDRPLQSGRPSAAAIAAQRKRDGDDRAFALARSRAALRPRRSGLCRRRQSRKWCAATGSSRAPP